MNNPIQSVHVKGFKGIKDALFDTSEINVLIGSNNSGKSTLAQAIHFSIAIFQSIQLAGRWGAQDSVSVSLSPDQLLYSPCRDLYALGHRERLKGNRAIDISMILKDGQKVSLSIQKGRNSNIAIAVDNVPVANELSSLETPYTIYSPGLAGIARQENYLSDGVLLRTIARGDANLVFRNVLLRLFGVDNTAAWKDFLSDLREIFPETSICVDFQHETDEFVDVYVDSDSEKLPIELAGTGVLQSMQILAYVHYFHPSVIILDEPDSHLHPNNQRLLCELLQNVAEERNTQVILTTHSRHVVDALSGQAAFLWVRNGTVEPIAMDQNHDLAILLDIGALDVKEMLSQVSAKCIVLTEDARKRGLEVLLKASSFPMKNTLVLAYHGCTSPNNLRPLLQLIRGSNTKATIVVHRDRDYLTDKESANWEIEIRNMYAEPFLTQGVDIESHFLGAAHLASLNTQKIAELQDLLKQATDNTRELSIQKYVNGRTDIEKKNGTFGKLNVGQLATKAPKSYDADTERYRHSKTVLKELRRLYQEEHGFDICVFDISESIAITELQDIAKKIKK